jgi:hypothetical protein
VETIIQPDGWYEQVLSEKLYFERREWNLIMYKIISEFVTKNF